MRCLLSKLEENIRQRQNQNFNQMCGRQIERERDIETEGERLEDKQNNEKLHTCVVEIAKWIVIVNVQASLGIFLYKLSIGQDLCRILSLVVGLSVIFHFLSLSLYLFFSFTHSLVSGPSPQFGFNVSKTALNNHHKCTSLFATNGIIIVAMDRAKGNKATEELCS